MRISRKLILTFVSVAIVSSVACIIGLIEMTNMNEKYSDALVNYGFSQGDIGLFHAEFNNSRVILKDTIETTDDITMNANTAKLKESNTKIDAYLKKMQKSMMSQKESSYYSAIKSNLIEYRIVSDEVVGLAKTSGSSEAQAQLLSDGTPLADKISASIDALISEHTSGGNKAASDLHSQGNLATIFILVILAISFIVSLVIALAISHGISKPVKEMAEAAQRMAKGDLSVQISVNSKDEIGQLGISFAESIASIKAYITDITRTLGEMGNGNLTVTSELEYIGDYTALKNSCDGILLSFNDTIGQIKQASEQVSGGSEQVSNGAQTLAQGATEQASSIEELSATIDEISAHVKGNAKHAAEASENVKNVRSEIEISNRHMNEMVAAMSQINDSSSQIGKIIKTIEDIAFQTNILALNAAVEAARAGSAGKGFAVVADEVRNLASKSAEAAKDTTSMIENSMKQVVNGTKIADETAKSLLRVVESTKAVSDTVEKISKASTQQADSISQVTLGVDQISGVVQKNSASAEESAAASEELSNQAQIMKELVGKFKFRNQTSQKQETEIEKQQTESDEIYSHNSKYESFYTAGI